MNGRSRRSSALSMEILLLAMLGGCVWIPSEDYDARIKDLKTKDSADPDSDSDSDSDADTDSDTDQDGDGYLPPDDCDDQNEAVHPGQEEDCGDGIPDNNCDGIPGECGLESRIYLNEVDGRVMGESMMDYAGGAVALGDVNGDRRADLLIGTERQFVSGELSGAAYYFESPVIGLMTLDDADQSAAGTYPGDLFGASVHIADLNDDDRGDVLVGAPQGDTLPALIDAGSVLVLSLVDDSIEERLIQGERALDGAGAAIASGDINSDDLTDLIVGAPGSDRFADNGGAVYGLHTDERPVTELGDADVTLLGTTDDEQVGTALATGDLEGEGLDLILVGSRETNDGAGRVYVVSGDISGSMQLSGATSVYTGEKGGAHFGHAIASRDMDDDGFDDLLVGAPDTGVSDEPIGAVYFIRAPTPTCTSASLPSFYGNNSGDLAGYSVATGDLNHDRYPDLIIGAPGVDTDGEDMGAVYVFYGPISGVGSTPVTDADVQILGSDSGQLAGWSLASGDMNGDDTDDLVVGAPGASYAGDYSGCVFIILGEGY